MARRHKTYFMRAHHLYNYLSISITGINQVAALIRGVISKTLLLLTLFSTSNVLLSEQLTDYYKDTKLLMKVEKKDVARFISDICLDWNGAQSSRKAESQNQVLFYDSTGQNSALFFRAIEDLNSVFGYQKLSPQITASEHPQDGSILIYYGPRSAGRKILLNFGSKRPSGNFWSSWSVWDKNNSIQKSVIAIFNEDAQGMLLAYSIRRSLLITLGYPGNSECYPEESGVNDGGIFNEKRFYKYFQIENNEDNEKKLISNYDRAVIRFADRFLSTDSRRFDMNRAIKDNWYSFVKEFSESSMNNSRDLRK